MPSARLRCAVLTLLALACASCSQAADNTGHALPSRPGSTAPSASAAGAGRNGRSVEVVSIAQMAAKLGLRSSTREGGRIVTLTGAGSMVAEFEADSRDVTINRLRVFLGSPVMTRQGELCVSRIDFERCIAPLLRPGFGVAPLGAPHVIVLDPGHGGGDTGAANSRVGILEKALTLDVGLRVRKLLAADGFTVVMTRTTDRELSPKKDIDLPMRADIANRAHADLFVSIHFNVVERDPQHTRGTEVYTFPPANQHATDWWSGMPKDDPHFETQDAPVNRFDHWNVVLAQCLHRELLSALKTDDRGKKLMHLGVLRSLNCPGVLVEPAVISNDAEARRLASPEFRQQIAEALRDGIRAYVETLDKVRRQGAASSATSRRRHTSRSS